MQMGSRPSFLQERNRRLVLDILRTSEVVTIANISQRTQLSTTTLLKTIDYFMQINLVTSAGKGSASDGGGKRPALYRFNASYGYVICIALFGTSILFALADARSNIFYKETVFIKENERIERVVDLVSNFIAKWQRPGAPRIDEKMKLLGIVMASTGVIDPARGICLTASRFSAWESNTQVRALIQDKVRLRVPFIMDNYNRFFAFAEKSMGCAKGRKTIIDIVAGYDGLGAGVIIDESIRRGPRYLSGEIGHMCLNPFDVEVCHCGGRGCFEQLVSCERLIRKVESGRAEHPESNIFRDAAGKIVLQDIFDASNEGDSFACQLMDEIINWFAIGITNVVLAFDPEIIIISGDYRNAGAYFRKELSRKMDKVSLVRMEKHVDIAYSSYDEEGAILGSASYILDDYFANRLQFS